MNHPIAGMTSVVGRVMIATIFLMSAVGNKIPNFNDVTVYMASKGVPAPNTSLVLAIIFLIAGSLSIILGYKARLGAGLIFVFLLLATFYFHDFWNLQGEDRQREMIQFMKNLSMTGAMVFLMANGSGLWSLDRRLKLNSVKEE